MTHPVKIDKRNSSRWPLEKSHAKTAKILKAKLIECGGSTTVGKLVSTIYPSRYKNINVATAHVSNVIYRWLWLNVVKTNFRNNAKIVKWKGYLKKTKSVIDIV